MSPFVAFMRIDATHRAMLLWLKPVCGLLSAETAVHSWGSPCAQDVTGTNYCHSSATSSRPHQHCVSFLLPVWWGRQWAH